MMDISMSALVIIDAQNAIFSLKQPIYGEEMLKEKLALLTDWASHNHVKIICTQHNNNSFLKKGTPGWEVIELLRIPAGSIMIEKNKPSIFEKTELHTLLQAAGIKTLMLAGLISNGCVKDSCIDALRLNYEVVPNIGCAQYVL